MIELYGIPNCGSVKKACQWLSEQGIEYVFINFKKTPPSVETIRHWLNTVGADKLINRRGTTWRKLTENERQSTENEDGAVALLTAQPSLIKRPLMHWADGQMTVGFDETLFQQHIQN